MNRNIIDQYPSKIFHKGSRIQCINIEVQISYKGIGIKMINFQVSIASHKKIQLHIRSLYFIPTWPTNTHQTNLGDISRYPRLRMPPSQVIPRQGSGLQLRLGHEITIAPSSLITSRPWKCIYLLLSVS